MITEAFDASRLRFISLFVSDADRHFVRPPRRDEHGFDFTIALLLGFEIRDDAAKSYLMPAI